MVKIIKMFKKNTLSVEIVKDNCLQKVNFRVKDKVPYRTLKYRTVATVTSGRWQLRNVVSGCAVLYVRVQKTLREDVKEVVKWNVDRSSPTNKIRDFMAWSTEVLEDIKVLSLRTYSPLSLILLLYSSTFILSDILFQIYSFNRYTIITLHYTDFYSFCTILAFP